MGLFASAIGLLLLWHSSYCPASICAAAAAAATAGEEGPSCTAPRPTSDALRPFCFIPRSTISTEAQKVLQERRVLPGGSLREASREKVLEFQAAYNARTAPVSEAARRAHLQDVSSAVIAGVTTFTATPKGCVSNSSSSSSRLLVYLHGGAYVKGSCDKLWQVTALTSQLSGIRVMCVDYRLAPLHPFPAGLSDALGVYRALTTEQRYKPSSIGLLGDSAGGGLSLALLQRIRQEKLGLPGAVGLLAPWCDLRKSGDTLTTLTGIDPVLQYDQNLAGPALDYVAGDAARLSDPLVSPLLAEYGRRQPFPPTLIQVGLRDSLLSSSVLLYRKMVGSGLKDVVLSPWEGMWHVFQASLEVPEAQQAAQEMAAFFKQHLH